MNRTNMLLLHNVLKGHAKNKKIECISEASSTAPGWGTDRGGRETIKTCLRRQHTLWSAWLDLGWLEIEMDEERKMREIEKKCAEGWKKNGFTMGERVSELGMMGNERRKRDWKGNKKPKKIISKDSLTFEVWGGWPLTGSWHPHQHPPPASTVSPVCWGHVRSGTTLREKLIRYHNSSTVNHMLLPVESHMKTWTQDSGRNALS